MLSAWFEMLEPPIMERPVTVWSRLSVDQVHTYAIPDLDHLHGHTDHRSLGS